MPSQHPSISDADTPCKYTAVDRHENDQSMPWTPFFLRRSTILIFLCCFLSVLVALVALYVYTEREGHSLGITTEERYYHLWTYGPTAVFTILAAGWTQVEYRAAQLMPWVLMRRGPTPSSESIFLDYISQWNIISLYQSLKKKHFLVSLCVAGSLLLNGVTVFSTGLFELQSVPISHQESLAVPKKFNDSAFDPTIGHDTTYGVCSGFADYNMTRPYGLEKTFVYTPFYPASSFSTGNSTIPDERQYEAEIDLIEPFLECHETTASWDTGVKPLYLGHKVWIGENSEIPANVSLDSLTYNTTVLSSEGCRYKMDPGTVNDTLLASSEPVSIEIEVRGCRGESPSDLDPAKASDWRLWASLIDTTDAKLSGDEVLRSVWPTPPYRGFMCKPRFNAYRGPVKISRQPGIESISTEIRRQSLKASNLFANRPAGEILLSAYNSMPPAFKAGLIATEYLPAFKFIKQQETPGRVFWNDMSLLKGAIQDDLSCLMRQTIMDKLLEPQLQTIEGVFQTNEKRLFVRVLSFGLMTGLLTCLIAISVILLRFFVPVAVCLSDTSSIGGMITVFAHSPEFMTMFGGTDLKSESEMAETALGQAQYLSLGTEGSFKIISQDDPKSDRNIKESTEKPPDWWYPLASTWGIRISVIIVPMLVMIALEVVQHISTSSRGIAFVGDKSSFIHYVWIYIPALIMFIIRCLFTCVESGVRIIQPYSTLRGKSAPPETTIFENQLRKIAIYGLIETTRKKQWALAAATASLFLAAMTPAVVSGLYTVDAPWPTFPTKILQTSRWNLGDPDLAQHGTHLKWWNYENEDFNDQQLAGLIIQLNLSYPQWTHNNLAFPGFKIADTVKTPEMGYIDIQIPALRSPLVCEEAQVDCEFRANHGENGSMSLTCGADDPCYRYGLRAIRSTNDTQEYFQAAEALFYARDGYAKTPSNCSTHNILYGKWGKDLESTEYHWYNCNATIEEAHAETRLQIPSFSVDSDVQPQIVPSSGKALFATKPWSFPDFDTIGVYLYSQISLLKIVSPLHEAMTKGIDGVPAEELLRPAVFIKRLETVWGIVTAKLLESNARENFQDPLNTSWLVHPARNDAPIYEGTFHDGRSYLVQNEISTRILDGLLGGMIICALIACFSMRTKDVLPKSPCSLASVASFVAGSKLLGIMRDAEQGGKDLSRERFSMGWWEVEPETVGMSIPASPRPPSSTENREVPEQEGTESIGESNEMDSHSIYAGSDSESLIGHQDEESEEGRRTSPTGILEETTHSNQSTQLLSRASSFSSNGDTVVKVESPEALTRFGIDIDGYRPLLSDVR
ncbi:unnamed protein product [Penicillium olsonii]|uniref:Uncharacterized protein n=1 Tax=Penicillium olsonii TaxID=99116 RepID=A0A9W4I767_PENOL|nr:unnamed protein product [Penicillium olsonii]CAG8254507.1 unnamed protein product [Penicillium olsonii]